MLCNLIAQVPPIDPTNLPDTLHPALRKTLLAELGRCDASLAFRVASHLWARDLVALSSEGGVSTPRLPGPSLTPVVGWTPGDEWACLAVMEMVSESAQAPLTGKALFVPAALTQSIVFLLPDQLVNTEPVKSAEPPINSGSAGASASMACCDALRVATDSALAACCAISVATRPSKARGNSPAIRLSNSRARSGCAVL